MIVYLFTYLLMLERFACGQINVMQMEIQREQI